MEKLVSSSEAAKILGISLQGIHYRIKKGQLKSIKQDGKIFVYVNQNDIDSLKDETPKKVVSHSTIKNESLQQFSGYDVIKVKDEQIELLKKTIKFIKKQKDEEINRLQNEQNRIVNVFQSEVDLLKSAFNEMKSMYQIENNSSNDKKDDIIVDDIIVEDTEDIKPKSQAQSVKDRLEAIRRSNRKDNLEKEKITEVEELIKVEKPVKESREIISLKDFFVLMRNHNKTNNEIKLIILDRVRANDERFEYHPDTQDVTIYKDEFLDLF